MNKITIVLLFVGAFVLINCRSDSRKYSKKNHLINRLEKPLVCNYWPNFLNLCNSLQSNLRWYNHGPNCYQFVDYGCTSDASFFLTESDCLAKCQNATGCVVPQCSADLSCPYGRNVDSRGCFTCQCRDPCKAKPCTAGKVCKVFTPQCNDEYPCFEKEVALCVANCPDLACPYGVNTTSTTCKCQDECLSDSGTTKCTSNLLCRRRTYNNFGYKRFKHICEAYMKYWIIVITKIISKSEFEIYQRMVPIYTEYLKTYISTYFTIDFDPYDIFKISVSNDTKSSTNKVVEIYFRLRAANSVEEYVYNILFKTREMSDYIALYKGVTFRIDSIFTNNCPTANSTFKAKIIQTSTGDKEEENNNEEEKSDRDEKNEEEKSDEDEKSDEEEKSDEKEENNDEEEKSDEEDNDEKEITRLNRHQWN